MSYVETGRSHPSSTMLLLLSEHLDIPLRERNSLLLAGGYAPAYPMSTFGETPKSAVSQAIGRILDGHEPYPALVVDRHW